MLLKIDFTQVEIKNSDQNNQSSKSKKVFGKGGA